jgi:hypothetical protein
MGSTCGHDDIDAWFLFWGFSIVYIMRGWLLSSGSVCLQFVCTLDIFGFFDSGEHLLYIAGGSYHIDWGDEQLHRWLLDCGLLGGLLVFHAMSVTHLFPAPWRRCPVVMFLPSSRPGGERVEARCHGRIGSLWPSEHMHSHVSKVVKTHQTISLSPL